MPAQLEFDQISDAPVWRSDYERCREIYGVASTYVLRFRRHLIEASKDERLSRIQRDELLSVLTQIDDESRGR